MGQSRLLPRGLIAALLPASLLCGLLFFGACGGPDAGLLATADPERYYTGGGGEGFFSTSSLESDRGTIRGKVTYTGRKRPRRLDLSWDYCINANPNGMMSEDFLVGPKGELGGVLVYIKRGLNRIEFPVPDSPVILDQKSCRYIPHLAVARIGQTVLIKNSSHANVWTLVSLRISRMLTYSHKPR